MKRQYKILLVFILIGVILLTGCNQDRSNCVKSSGQWNSFSNSCADSCDFERGITTICSTVLTRGCDCGPEMCWNGIKCELN